MPTTAELLQQAEALNEARKYQQVIDLLPDSLLEERQSAELYTERARAYYNLGEYEKQFIDCNRAITLKAEYYRAFRYRGAYWFAKKMYDNSIADYTISITLNPHDADSYYNRGSMWFNKNEFDKAIEDFTQAINLKPTDSDALVNRGNALKNKGDYANAISDYNKAIAIKKNDENIYLNRGITYRLNNESESALADFSQAIELNPNFADAYNSRGNVWLEKENYESAFADYDRAVKLNPNYGLAFNNRGVALKKMGDIENAINDFMQSIQLNPVALYVHRNLADVYYDKGEHGKALEFYRKSIEVDNLNRAYSAMRIENIKARLNDKEEQELDSAAGFVIDILDKLEDKQRKKTLRNKALDLLDAMNVLRSHAHISNPQPVVHYTKLGVAELFVGNHEANLRFYNVLYMNDPEEGKVLLDYLDKQEKESTGIGQCFEAGRQAPDGDNNVYLGSFLPAPQHDGAKYSHEDELVLWRTYGKNEAGEEARGASIVIGGDFFDDNNQFVQHDGGNGNTEVSAKHTLYEVLYLDKRCGDVVMKDAAKAKKVNDDLLKLKTSACQLLQLGENDETKTIISQIVYRVLSELRYFFKSADYAFENECRVIKYATPEHERVTIDEFSAKPKKLFYNPELQVQPYIKKIIIGPRVPAAEDWKIYLDVSIAQNKRKDEFKPLLRNIEVRKSATKFQ